MDKWQAEKNFRPWLAVSLRPRVGVGCKTCADSKSQTPWGQFEINPRSLKMQQVEKHENSQVHKVASERCSNEEDLLLAPPMSEFLDAYENMRKGGSARQQGVSSDRKSRIRYCIAEAVIRRNAQFLRSASSVALLRDERKGRLLLRFRAAQADLSTLDGVLGLVDTEPSSEQLAAATTHALKVFCQPFTALPRGSKAVAKPYDRALQKNLKDKIQILTTDNASSEMLASQQLRGARPHATPGGLATKAALPNVKLVAKDSAHSSTRVLKRPFAKHPHINSVMCELVYNSESFCQKIFHSPLYSKWWKEVTAEEDEEGPGQSARVTSMCSAKHRFASYYQPLSRLIKNLPAAVKLMHRISSMRAGQDNGQWAGKTLATLNGEKLLLLGMCTDASASCLEFTRYNDQEGMDISQLTNEVAALVSQLRVQFEDGQCFHLPTYTKSCLDFLEGNPPMMVMHGGDARELRVDQAAKTRCLKVMKDGR